MVTIKSYELLRTQSYSIRWLEDHGRPCEQIDEWERGGAIFSAKGLANVEGKAYPQWQFDNNLCPKVWIAPLLKASKDVGLDSISLHFFMTAPPSVRSKIEVSGTFVEAADSGRADEVVQLIRTGN